MEDRKERPIAMSSRTLHSFERRYAQIDKEATAIMFGIQKFHNYLMGRSFTIITDHKPLLGIFDPKKQMSNMMSPRLLRIAIALTSHDYSIVYRPGKEIVNADALSRWPQPISDEAEEQLSEILLMAEKPEDFPSDSEKIAVETRKDKILSQVVHYVQRGWPSRVTDSNLRTYWLNRDKLSLQNGCLLLGCRVVIPTSQRTITLQALHSTHGGIVQTKALARSYVWWPHLNKDIEIVINGCTNCLENRHMPSKIVHKWITPTRPWSQIHIDFAGPFHNKTFLIVVDAYSRWPEVSMVNSISSGTVIKNLRMLFATHGLCETLVSDIGTAFTSAEIKQFLTANNIRHISSAPYHPATNGLAERMVQTVKDKLRRMNDVPWDIKVPNMLLGLKVTPCSTTHQSPAELLMNRRLRTLLDTVHLDNLQNKKVEKEIMDNRSIKNREIQREGKVMFRNYSNGPKWIPGKIVYKSGPVHYKVKTNDGAVVNRYIDQIVKISKQDNDIRNEEVIEENIEEEVEEERERGIEEQYREENNTDDDDIIEIPSSDKWAEILGIPEPEKSSAGGKIRHRTNIHSRSPYDRQDASNYMC